MPCFGTEHTAGAESLIKIHRLRLSAFCPVCASGKAKLPQRA